MNPRYHHIGGYINTDPYYISAEEEAALEMQHRFDRTDDIECWHVEFVASQGAWVPFCEVHRSKASAELGAKNHALQPGHTCIRVTGPHLHRFPAPTEDEAAGIRSGK